VQRYTTYLFLVYLPNTLPSSSLTDTHTGAEVGHNSFQIVYFKIGNLLGSVSFASLSIRTLPLALSPAQIARPSGFGRYKFFKCLVLLLWSLSCASHQCRTSSSAMPVERPEVSLRKCWDRYGPIFPSGNLANSILDEVSSICVLLSMLQSLTAVLKTGCKLHRALGLH
jgi:hypothetical protein